MEIVSRKTAKELGLTHYFTGKPCGDGHIAPRAVHSTACCQCRYEHHVWLRKLKYPDYKPRGPGYNYVPMSSKALRNNSASRRRATKLKATPKWADMDKIKQIYIKASTCGHHVDHIVPLRSKFVCGLHCEANLQILEPSINMSKGNRWWPDMP
jgi:hypothetical protein